MSSRIISTCGSASMMFNCGAIAPLTCFTNSKAGLLFTFEYKHRDLEGFWQETSSVELDVLGCSISLSKVLSRLSLHNLAKIVHCILQYGQADCKMLFQESALMHVCLLPNFLSPSHGDLLPRARVHVRVRPCLCLSLLVGSM